MTYSPRSQQAGYVLVTVLILTLVASMVVFVSLRQNHLLERMGGNQQKMLNANLAAGRGVADSLTLIQGKLAAGASVTDIQTALVRELTGVYAISGVSYAAPRLSFISKGMFQDAVAYKKANFSLTTGAYPFNAGVVACSALSLTGSGAIDSYDPSKGGYGSSNKNANSKVEVIDAGSSTVTLTGASPINGDLTIKGSAELQGSAKVTGTVTTSANLNLSGGGVKIGAAAVGGNLNMGASSQISGTAAVTGNVTANPGTTVGSMTYGGTLTNSNAHNGLTATTGSLVNQATAAPVLTNTVCDPLNITSAFSSYAGLTSSGLISGYHWQQTTYSFTPSSAQVYASSAATTTTTVSPTTASVFGSSASVYVLDSLDVSGSTLSISGGNVTIIVKGNFSMTGGGPTIQIASGSSLTLLVQGTTDLGSNGSFVVADAGAGTNNNISPLSIYSSYSGSNGVTTGGGFNGGYASIYAPLTDVAIGGSGSLSGAVRGKTLTVTGAGGLHYDESLANAAVGSHSGSIKLYAIQDYYP